MAKVHDEYKIWLLQNQLHAWKSHSCELKALVGDEVFMRRVWTAMGGAE